MAIEILGKPTRAELGRFRLDPLIAGLCHPSNGLTAGAAAARIVLDAGIDIGFGHWIHSASVSLVDSRLDSIELTASITDRHTDAESGFRAVTLRQGPRVLGYGQVSFEAPLTGAHPDRTVDIGDTPDPHSVRAIPPADAAEHLPVDVRPIDGGGRTWTRFHSELPDDLLVHVAALALAGDRVVAHRLSGVSDCRTINYGLWIHRCFRADDWMLAIEKVSHFVGRRAFVTYSVVSPHGRPIATVAQEVQVV